MKISNGVKTLKNIATQERPPIEERTTLVDALDKVLEKGAVVDGEIAIRVADVDLVFVGLKLLITSVSRAESLRSGQKNQDITNEDKEYMRILENEIKRAEENIPRIIDAGNPKKAEKGIAQLVLTLVKLIKDLMYREAKRRIKKGSLSEAEIQKLGLTFNALDKKIEEIRAIFGLEDEELNIDLGPLGKLM
ncbi:gas vesicle protein K [Patescibacteria group bacterium]|nr:gas vesicle protein K [Patescibacteria group bacterium]MBU4579646.1 gas vesicle protein K [Patescibacteria group bacterium]